MRHLTHSGYYAGQTICGTPRNAEDTYQHYGLTYSIKNLDDLCPKCKQIYLNMENDYNENDYNYEKETGRCSKCGRLVNDCTCD